MATSPKTIQKVVGLVVILAAIGLALSGALDLWKNVATYAADTWDSVKGGTADATQPAVRSGPFPPDNTFAFVQLGGAVPLLIGGIVVTVLGFKKPRVGAP